MIFASFILASTVAASSPNISDCAKLSRQYDNVSMELSSIDAEGASDDSAPREQVRQIKSNTEVQKAQIIVYLMQSAKCIMPTYAPDYIYYALPALQCQNDLMEDRLGGRTDLSEKTKTECNRDNWTSLKH